MTTAPKKLLGKFSGKGGPHCPCCGRRFRARRVRATITRQIRRILKRETAAEVDAAEGD